MISLPVCAVGRQIYFTPLDADCLPSGDVSCLYQDSEGFLWIATYSGIVRYDGYCSVPYELYSESGNTFEGTYHVFCEDNEFNLYVGTENGVLTLDRNQDRLIKIQQPEIQNLEVTDIITDKSGRTWVCGDLGVFRKDQNGVFIRQELRRDGGEEPLSDAVDMLVDPFDNLWITSWNKGLYRYDLNTGKIFRYTVGDLSSSYVLHCDDDDNLWIGTWGKGLLKVDLENVTDEDMPYERFFHDTRRESSLLDNIIYDIDQDSDGNIWVGSRSGLSILIDQQRKVFRNEYPKEGYGSLPYNEVNAILRTRDGTMWLGMMGGGVCKIDLTGGGSNDIIFLDINSVRDKYKTSSVRCMCQVDPNIYWFGLFGRGMILYDVRTETFQNYSELPCFDDFPTISTADCIIRRRNGEYVFGTYDNGLWLCNPDLKTASMINSTTRAVMSDDCIHALAEDEDGNIWIGTDNGCVVMDTLNRVATLSVSDEELRNSKILDISHDPSRKSTVWMATDGNGVIRMEMFDDMVHARSYFGEGRGSVCQFISVHADSQGNVWAGSLMNGLYLYDEETDTFIKQNYLAFLENKSVINIAEGPVGQLWMTTEEIVFSFRNKELLMYHDLSGKNSFSSFNRNSSMYLSDEGNMIFGCNKGIALFPCRREMTDAARNHDISITDFYCNGLSYRDITDSRPFRSDADVHCKDGMFYVSASRPDISIHFSLFEFMNTYNTVFWYRLSREGNDDSQWCIAGGKEHVAVFKNLKPGNYCFEICGMRTSTFNLSKVKSLNFKVLRNPWVSWWMILLYVVVSGAFVVTVLYIVRNGRKQVEVELIPEVESEPDAVHHQENSAVADETDDQEDIIKMSFDIRKVDMTPPNQVFMQKVLKIVNEHLADSDFRQADFAREMAVSQTVLTERIKAMTGVTPMAFLTNARLKMAYTIIQEVSEHIHVADLAYSVGFNDAKYFSKKFKEKYGKSPNKMMTEIEQDKQD